MMRLRLDLDEIRRLIDEVPEPMRADKAEHPIRYGRVTITRLIKVIKALITEVEAIDSRYDEATGKPTRYSGTTTQLQRKIDDGDRGLQMFRHTDECLRKNFMKGRVGGDFFCIPVCQNAHQRALKKVRE